MKIYKLNYTLVLLFCGCILYCLNPLLAQQTQENTDWISHYSGHKKLTVSEIFEFSKLINIEMISGKKSSADKLNFSMRYPNDYQFMSMRIDGLKEPTPEILLDFKNDLRITFMKFDNAKMARINQLQGVQNHIALLNVKPRKYKNTGKTSDILGYHTVEYFLDGDEFSGSVWVTKELESDLKKPFADLGLRADYDITGYILKVDGKSKSSNEIMKLNVTGINLNELFQIDCKEYTPVESLGK